MPIQNLKKNVMRKQVNVTSSDTIESARKLVNVEKERIHTETEFHAEPKQMPDRVTFTVNGEHDTSSSSVNSGRSAEHWRRLALLRSGDVEPNPGPPRARRALDDFDMFLAVRDCGSRGSLLSHGLEFVVEAAPKYLEWSFGSGELSSGAAETLVAALRRLVPLPVSLGASVLGSTFHFRALWRLHKSWLYAVPPEFRTFVDFKLALGAATVSGEIELGLSYVRMFHCLLRPGEWREVTWKDILIFENSQNVSGGASLCSGSGAQHAADLQAVLRRLGLVNSPFTLAGFRGGGATDNVLRCRDVLALRRRERWS